MVGKTIEGTDIINYPEEFRESGLETREFLYWAASIDAYIDDSVPRIKPGDKLSDVDFLNIYASQMKEMYCCFCSLFTIMKTN